MATGALAQLHDRDDLVAPALATVARRQTTSYTSGWWAMACSTSSAKIFSPPELMVTESRP